MVIMWVVSSLPYSTPLWLLTLSLPSSAPVSTAMVFARIRFASSGPKTIHPGPSSGVKMPIDFKRSVVILDFAFSLYLYLVPKTLHTIPLKTAPKFEGHSQSTRPISVKANSQ